MENNKKKKFYFSQVFTLIIYVLVGFVSGFLLASQLDELDMASAMLVLCASYLLAFILTIIVHEDGHLVFGLLSGYKFCSFRVGSFMWINDNGKIKLKRFSLAGTGGQCLMSPPDMIDGKIPVALYNLGGSLMNIIFGLVFLVLSLTIQNSLAVYIFGVIAIINFAVALINGIPLRLPMTDNDGYNALSLGKNPKSLRAFWLQLKINETVSKGKRIKDMPKEWFEIPQDEDMNNSMISTIGVFCCNRLMDEHRFEEADELMAHYLSMDVLIGIHKGLIICERICCEILGENRLDVIENMLDKEQKQIMKAMKSSLPILRTEYLYHAFCKKDLEKSQKIKKALLKAVEKYPYPVDTELDMEIIELAEAKFKEV